MMIEGIKAALDYPYTDGRTRDVLFLTDGYIGNEMEIFQETEKRLDKARVFSLGVGAGPNRHLLDGLARAGRGAVTGSAKRPPTRAHLFAQGRSSHRAGPKAKGRYLTFGITARSASPFLE